VNGVKTLNVSALAFTALANVVQLCKMTFFQQLHSLLPVAYKTH